MAGGGRWFVGVLWVVACSLVSASGASLGAYNCGALWVSPTGVNVTAVASGAVAASAVTCNATAPCALSLVFDADGAGPLCFYPTILLLPGVYTDCALLRNPLFVETTVRGVAGAANTLWTCPPSATEPAAAVHTAPRRSTGPYPNVALELGSPAPCYMSPVVCPPAPDPRPYGPVPAVLAALTVVNVSFVNARVWVRPHHGLPQAAAGGAPLCAVALHDVVFSSVPLGPGATGPYAVPQPPAAWLAVGGANDTGVIVDFTNYTAAPDTHGPWSLTADGVTAWGNSSLQSVGSGPPQSWSVRHSAFRALPTQRPSLAFLGLTTDVTGSSSGAGGYRVVVSHTTFDGIAGADANADVDGSGGLGVGVGVGVALTVGGCALSNAYSSIGARNAPSSGMLDPVTGCGCRFAAYDSVLTSLGTAVSWTTPIGFVELHRTHFLNGTYGVVATSSVDTIGAFDAVSTSTATGGSFQCAFTAQLNVNVSDCVFAGIGLTALMGRADHTTLSLANSQWTLVGPPLTAALAFGSAAIGFSGRELQSATVVNCTFVRLRQFSSGLALQFDTLAGPDPATYRHGARLPIRVWFEACRWSDSNSADFAALAVAFGQLYADIGFTGLTFVRCSGFEAGALNVQVVNDSPGRVWLNDSTFTQNVAKDGAAIGWNVGSRATSVLSVLRCAFVANTAWQNGGVLFAEGYGTLNLENCTFAQNSAKLNGGAIYGTSRSKVNVYGCRLSNNSAVVYGGAIYVDRTAQLKLNPTGADHRNIRNTFQWNSALYGGAIQCRDAANVNSLFGADFVENFAGQNGGAISLSPDATLLSSGNAYVGNAAAVSGGAIFVESLEALISGDTFAGNSAGERGGAILLDASYRHDIIHVARLLSTTFTGNFISANPQTGIRGAGGAVCVTGQRRVVFNACTFVGNRARGGMGGAVSIASAISSTGPIVPTVWFAALNVFTGNSACQGGALWCGGDAPHVPVQFAFGFGPKSTAQGWGTVQLSNNTAYPCDPLPSGQGNAGGAVFYQFGGPNTTTLNDTDLFVWAPLPNTAPGGSGQAVGAGFTDATLLITGLNDMPDAPADDDNGDYPDGSGGGSSGGEDPVNGGGDNDDGNSGGDSGGGSGGNGLVLSARLADQRRRRRPRPRAKSPARIRRISPFRPITAPARTAPPRRRLQSASNSEPVDPELEPEPEAEVIASGTAVYWPGQTVIVNVELFSMYGNAMTSVPVLEVVVSSPCWPQRNVTSSFETQVAFLRNGFGQLTLNVLLDLDTLDALVANATAAREAHHSGGGHGGEGHNGDSGDDNEEDEDDGIQEVVSCPLVFRASNAFIAPATLHIDVGRCPVGWGSNGVDYPTLCVRCSQNEYSIGQTSGACQSCAALPHTNCTIEQMPTPALGWWLLVDDRARTVAEYACPPGFCDNPDRAVVCNAHRAREPDNVLCAECERGFSEWLGNCIPCSGTHWGVVFGSAILTFALIGVLHVLVQWAWGTFSIVLFFVQIGAFVLYPETAQFSTAVEILSSTLINVGGSAVCPFPLVTPADVVGFAYFSAMSSVLFLGAVYAAHLAWSLVAFCRWYVSFATRCRNPCGHACDHNRAAQRCCAPIARLLAAASTPRAFQRSLLAFVLTSYEPFLEVTLNFMTCEEVGPQHRVVLRKPDVRCTRYWELYFVPPLFVVLLVPVVLLVLLRRELGKPNSVALCFGWAAKVCCTCDDDHHHHGDDHHDKASTDVAKPLHSALSSAASDDASSPYVLMDRDGQDAGHAASELGIPLLEIEPAAVSAASPSLNGAHGGAAAGVVHSRSDGGAHDHDAASPFVKGGAPTPSSTRASAHAAAADGHDDDAAGHEHGAGHGHVLSMLSHHFKDRYHWWELYSVGRRAALLIAAAILPANYLTARLLFAMLLFAFTLIHVRAQPYVHALDNALEMVSLVSLTLIAAVSASSVWAAEEYGRLHRWHLVTFVYALLVVIVLALPVLYLCLQSSRKLMFPPEHDRPHHRHSHSAVAQDAHEPSAAATAVGDSEHSAATTDATAPTPTPTSFLPRASATAAPSEPLAVAPSDLHADAKHLAESTTTAANMTPSEALHN